MNQTAQRICVWSGVPLLVLFFVGFGLIAGFMPPPSPRDSAQQVADMYAQDRDKIRLGLIIGMIGATMIVPFSAAIATQMRRMEGEHSVLSRLVLGAGALLSLEFIYPMYFWHAAAFREDRGPDLIQALNDAGWLPFISLLSTAIIMFIAMGVCMLLRQSVFPRWAGYFNIWAGASVTFGIFAVFPEDGPIAWNGLLSFWIPVAVFAPWVIVNLWLLLRAIDSQDEPQAQPHSDLLRLERQVADMRLEINEILDKR